MFYDIFSALCEKKGVSKTKETLEVGFDSPLAHHFQEIP